MVLPGESVRGHPVRPPPIPGVFCKVARRKRILRLAVFFVSGKRIFLVWGSSRSSQNRGVAAGQSGEMHFVQWRRGGEGGQTAAPHAPSCGDSVPEAAVRPRASTEPAARLHGDGGPMPEKPGESRGLGPDLHYIISNGHPGISQGGKVFGGGARHAAALPAGPCRQGAGEGLPGDGGGALQPAGLDLHKAEDPRRIAADNVQLPQIAGCAPIAAEKRVSGILQKAPSGILAPASNSQRPAAQARRRRDASEPSPLRKTP